MAQPIPSNFSVLAQHDEQLLRLGMLAERYFAEDPNTCLLKLRQLTELLAQLVATRVGLYLTSDEKQVDLVRRLQDNGIVPREVGSLFTEVRRAGNDANHQLAGDHRTALPGSTVQPVRKTGPWMINPSRVQRFLSGWV
jgi:type I restriction enzyme, R subunit